MKVPFCKPDVSRKDRIAVMDALKCQWLTCGERTVAFEEAFAKYVGVSHAIAVSSGTAALHLAMKALDIREGDEVIVPTMTFAATANAPIFCGATPVFADIDEDTLNISPDSIGKHITKKTKAIIPVHYGGLPCSMDKILGIAMSNNLYVVEDCAHSLGATFEGIQTGAMSHIGTFSMYPTKPLICGEGGMVTTDNEYLAERMVSMRSHCMTKDAFERCQECEWKYDVVDLGYNFRIDEMSAALGLSQMLRVDEMREKRAAIAKLYDERLGNVKGLILPKIGDKRTSSYHLYVIRVAEGFGMSRDELFKGLVEKEVESSVHYTPLNLMSFYQRKYGCKIGDCPTAEKVYNEILSLPIYSAMFPWQAQYVVSQIEALAR